MDLLFKFGDDVLDVTASLRRSVRHHKRICRQKNQPILLCWAWKEAIAFCNQTLDQANAKLEEIAQQVAFEIESIVKSSRKFENQWLRKEWMY